MIDESQLKWSRTGRGSISRGRRLLNARRLPQLEPLGALARVLRLSSGARAFTLVFPLRTAPLLRALRAPPPRDGPALALDPPSQPTPHRSSHAQHRQSLPRQITSNPIDPKKCISPRLCRPVLLFRGIQRQHRPSCRTSRLSVKRLVDHGRPGGENRERAGGERCSAGLVLLFARRMDQGLYWTIKRWK